MRFGQWALFFFFFNIQIAFSMTPSAIYPVTNYSVASDLSSQSPIRQQVAKLVQAYNQRFLGADGKLQAQLVNPKDEASLPFIDLQEKTIQSFKTAGVYQPLFTVTNNDNLKIDLFALVDENKNLVAVCFDKVYYSDTKAKSILKVRPLASLVGGQTMQDAHDFAAFVMDTPSALNVGTGGAFNIKYATNVTFSANPPLEQRTWAVLPWQLLNRNGSWAVYDKNRIVQSAVMTGGVLTGVKIKQIIYKQN